MNEEATKEEKGFWNMFTNFMENGGILVIFCVGIPIMYLVLYLISLFK